MLASSRQIVEQGAVGMAVEEFRGQSVIERDERHQVFELLSKHAHGDGACLDDGRVARQRLSGFDTFESFLDFWLATALMSVKNFLSLLTEAFLSESKLGHASKKSAAKAVVRSLSRMVNAREKKALTRF
jgi:hypothetical protein